MPSASHSHKVLGQVEACLQDLISVRPPEPPAPSGPSRPQVLPSLALWAGWLTCVARGFDSQLSLWRLLADGNFWHYPRFPISDQAVYNRLASGGLAPLQTLFDHVTQLLAERLQPLTATATFSSDSDLAPFAPCVVALDETTLAQTARYLPALRHTPAGDDQLLPGKLAALFDLRTQQWRKVEYIDNPHQNCKVLARPRLVGLPPSSLVLADLGYFGFEWFIELAFKLVKQHLGLHLWWSARPMVIQQQIWAVLSISQIVQGLRYEIARRAAADLFEVSVELYLPRYGSEGRDGIEVFVKLGRELRLIRPSKRTVVETPEIAEEAVVAMAVGMVVERTPRYARRQCPVLLIE